MIQRLQSVFLFLTFIITGLLFFLPVIQLEIPQNNTDLNPFFLFYTSKYVQAGNPSVFITYNWFSMILNIIITGLAFFTIFLYKKQLLQLRMCLVNIILMIGLVILVSIQAYNIVKPTGIWHIELGFCFPFIGIILTWLAMRGIIKDISILKSYDRIR